MRRCHGDLHLANIVLLHGRPVLFDCLEFSERLASIDVLYDLAFLVMDLLDRGLCAEAWRILQVYNDRRIEDEGFALMPLVLSVRAAMRAKVAGFTALSPEHVGNREQLSARARAYLALARIALEPSPVMLVAVGGRSGTGKSSFAAVVAPRVGAMPGAMVLRSDLVRKQLLGCEPTGRLRHTPPRWQSGSMAACSRAQASCSGQGAPWSATRFTALGAIARPSSASQRTSGSPSVASGWRRPRLCSRRG